MILAMLEDGAMSLTTVGLVAAHLDEDNHERLLHAARGLSKRDVEKLVAALDPHPDIASSVRALPAKPLTFAPVVEQDLMRQVVDAPTPPVAAPPRPSPQSAAESPRALVAPIGPTLSHPPDGQRGDIPDARTPPCPYAASGA